MIGRLTGAIEEDDDGALVVNVDGVGYEVNAPLGTAGRAARDAQGRATLFVHTHVREDAFVLYGFATQTERLAFRTLIAIPNVGPKTALSILSALPAAELARAIASKDVKRLTDVPGIGKKTAERLVLELRDKLPVVPGDAAAPQAPKARAPSGKRDALVSALLNMGYRASEADRAAAALEERLERAELAELLREALAVLAK